MLCMARHACWLGDIDVKHKAHDSFLVSAVQRGNTMLNTAKKEFERRIAALPRVTALG